jgi:peptidoglycan/LPS O-acetylase OafA/YrhL
LFFGNIFFLQTISIPCFGTNSPLWSLANEFWYYLLLPLLLTVFLPGRLLVRVPALLAAILLILLLPSSVLFGGLIWGLGAGVFFLIRRASVRSIAAHPLWLLLGLILTVGLLLATRTGHIGGWCGDLALGLGCAVLVAGLACTSSANSLYGKISAGLSDISYTLYLVHFPLMAFVFFVFFHGKQIYPTAATALCFGGLLSVTIAYSAVIWWLFERNTDEVRVFVESKIAQLSEADFIPVGVGADLLMSWLPVRRPLLPLRFGTATMSSILSSKVSYIREWWEQVLLRPRPAFAYHLLHPLLFIMLCYRC